MTAVCKPCGQRPPEPGARAPVVDPAGRVWAWCVDTPTGPVCWAGSDIPRSALTYVTVHGLTNPRKRGVTPEEAEWPEGTP